MTTSSSHTTLLLLSAILVIPEMQPRAKGADRKVVEQYRRAMEGGAVFPPIRVARVRETGAGPSAAGALVLVDGFHRVEALRALHRAEVEAEVVEAASMDDARWMAAEANLRHGQPLKKGEVREVFRRYLKAGQHHHGGRRRGRLKSYREMAADLPGVAFTTLRN